MNPPNNPYFVPAVELNLLNIVITLTFGQYAVSKIGNNLIILKQGGMTQVPTPDEYQRVATYLKTEGFLD